MSHIALAAVFTVGLGAMPFDFGGRTLGFNDAAAQSGDAESGAGGAGADVGADVDVGGGGIGVGADVGAGIGGADVDAGVDAGIGGGGADVGADADVGVGDGAGASADADAGVGSGGAEVGADADVGAGEGAGAGADASADASADVGSGAGADGESADSGADASGDGGAGADVSAGAEIDSGTGADAGGDPPGGNTPAAEGAGTATAGNDAAAEEMDSGIEGPVVETSAGPPAQGPGNQPGGRPIDQRYTYFTLMNLETVAFQRYRAAAERNEVEAAGAALTAATDRPVTVDLVHHVNAELDVRTTLTAREIAAAANGVPAFGAQSVVDSAGDGPTAGPPQ